MPELNEENGMRLTSEGPWNNRLERLKTRMTSSGIDAIIIGPTSHMVWLTGLAPHGDERAVALFVTPDFAGFLMPSLNAESSRQKTALPFFTWTDAEGPATALATLLAAAGLSRQPVSVALDEMLRADHALLFLDALTIGRRQFLSTTLGYLRTQKDEAEYKALRESAAINDHVMQAAFAHLTPGQSEGELADFIRETFRKQGAEAIFISVCFSENAAFPHHHSSGRTLRLGDLVLLDIGGRFNGYPSDMTRIGTCGRATAKHAEIWAIVDRAVQAALSATKPGVEAALVDKAARDVITAAGYGDKFLHRTGHGLGIDIHEEPYITATSDHLLEEGNVFSIEPGIYLDGVFGLRLEEIVILRNGKAEILSGLSRELAKVKS
jgi:Xaa-Pro dipeptidase